MEQADIARAEIAGTGSPAEIVARMDRLILSPFHRKVCGLIGLCSFFDSFDALVLPSALVVIVTSLHISFVNVGLLLSSAYVGMTIGALVFGWLSEIIGRKPLIVISVGSFGLLSIFAGFAWNYDSLIITRLVQGLALGGEIPVVTALYNEFLPGKARAMPFFYGFTIQFTAGLFVAPLVGLASMAIFGPEVGWRVLFGLGGLAILVAAAVQMIVPESPRFLAEKGRAAEADAVVQTFEASTRRKLGSLPPVVIRARIAETKTRFAELFAGGYGIRTLVSWVLFFCTNFVTYGLAGWLPTLYVRVGGLQPDKALMLSLVFGAVQLAAAFMWGALADRLGRRRGFIIGYSLAIIGMGTGVIATGWLGFSGWPVLVLVAFLTGLGIGFTASLCFLYTAEMFPTRMRSWAIATGTASNRIGSFVAPTVIGLLLGADLGIVSVFAAMGTTALIGLICLVTLGPETSKGTLEEVSATGAPAIADTASQSSRVA
jgi:putative MFS transporter